MIEKYIIIGRGSFGYELALYIHELKKHTSIEIGFIDEINKSKNDLEFCKNFGNFENFKFKSSDKVLISFGNPQKRELEYNRLKDKNINLHTFIHPNTYIASTSTIAQGTIITPFVTLAHNSKINANVLINTYGAVGHDSIIGNHSVLSPKSLVTGKCTLAEKVYLGSSAVILPGQKIGSSSKVSASSVVYRNVIENNVVLGNPAKKYKMPEVKNE